MFSFQQKVSVVMCTYNGENFIEQQIESILNQTYPLYELFIIDDCSTDNTISIIEKFASKKSFIQLYRNDKNLGYNKNFEKAMRMARGDIIAISDQDDVWLPDKIKTLIENWNDDTLIIYCNSEKFSHEIPLKPAKLSKKYKRFKGDDIRKLSLYNTVSGHAMLIKKKLVILALPIPENTIYDWWIAGVAAVNGGVTYISQTLVYQRVHDNNLTISNKKDSSLQKYIPFYKKLINFHITAFLKIPNLTKENKVYLIKLKDAL